MSLWCRQQAPDRRESPTLDACSSPTREETPHKPPITCATVCSPKAANRGSIMTISRPAYLDPCNRRRHR
jgi:hypothetical protein